MADDPQFHHAHEAESTHQKADTSKWDNNWEEINKQREEIKAIKDKKRIAKLEAEEYGVPIVDEEVQHKIEISHNKWKDTHEENAKVIKADTSKWDNDWDKINKQREEIKAMKEKKRISKLYAEQGISISDQETQDKIEESHNKWKDSHEENAKVIKADTSKWDNDWDKINKQREEIRAIKDKKRIAKLEAEEYGVAIVDEETQDRIEKSHNKWKDSHAKEAKVIKADTSKWDNDWDKINKQREEIRAIKQKKRMSKLAKEQGQLDTETKKKIEKSHNKWKDTHAKNAKVIKANTSKWDNDWDKINAKRAEIKAIKQKNRLAKLEKENELAERNKKKKETAKKFKGNAHEKTPKKQKATEKETKIEKERQKIKALKQKKREEKLKAENELAERNKKKKKKHEKNLKEMHMKKNPKKLLQKKELALIGIKLKKKDKKLKH